jgi:hypothetical protein
MKPETKQLTLNDVMDFIMKSDKFDPQAERQVVLALKLRRESSRASARNKFVYGQPVQFTSRTGQMIKGTVTKVNRVTIHVLANGVRWRVSPELLQKAEA